MSQGGYTQTILLDANRLSSEEYSASNLADSDNAIFTNKVSNGITIDIGDQVSIQSAHIAQRGAGGSVIQMNGDTLGKKNITYTKTTPSKFIGFLKDGTEEYSPTGYAYETSENITEEVDVKDNGASVVIEFYKNTNGENNIVLPRNFGVSENLDSVSSGQPATSGGSVEDWWNASDNAGLGLNTYNFTASHIFTPDYFDGFDQLVGKSSSGANCLVRKLKQDNSRYTLFKQSEIVWNHSQVSSASNASYLCPHGTSLKPDPAIGEYIRYREKIDLSVDPGYNTPSTISAKITDQLIQAEDPKVIMSASGSVIIDSATYKAFPCSNINIFDVLSASHYFNASTSDNIPNSVNASSTNHYKSVEYLNNYSFIGFKRPDFVEAGRAIGAYHGNKVAVNIEGSSSGTAVIYTDYSYNDETLIKLKRFFDSQIMYPELLDHATDASNDLSNYASLYPNATSASLNASFRKEARFLHLGLSGSGHTASAADPLGSDMYNVLQNNGLNAGPPRASASDQSSIPIFFYFNENCSNLTAEQTVGDTEENLAYGFARKWISGGSSLVALITKPIGGIPIEFFGEQLGSRITANTKIGYDYHFIGYGNSAIMLSNGYHTMQYYGFQSYIHGGRIRQAYCGANNPLLNFDTVENRFEFSNLHSAEKVGNFYNAGDPNPASGVLGPPPTAQAGIDCYKINKQLKYDTWSPSLQPYPDIAVSGTGTDKANFIDMNPNLLPSNIYDAHGGISLVDMGVSEDLWEKSIWGLLGFQYGQFNSSGNDVKNINHRFSNENSNSSGLTTNALITSQNSLQFSMNVWGTNLFNPNVNDDIYYWNASREKPAQVSHDHIVKPPIVISDNDLSTKIIANRLPRKLLRGYFLINSDILDTANYYQLANPLQTMAVVGKYNSANDFISYDGGGTVFTATRKKTITSVKTEILDPEGGTANVGDNSGVIYRIDKAINTDLKFAETLMSQMNSKK